MEAGFIGEAAGRASTASEEGINRRRRALLAFGAAWAGAMAGCASPLPSVAPDPRTTACLRVYRPMLLKLYDGNRCEAYDDEELPTYSLAAPGWGLAPNLRAGMSVYSGMPGRIYDEFVIPAGRELTLECALNVQGPAGAWRSFGPARVVLNARPAGEYEVWLMWAGGMPSGVNLARILKRDDGTVVPELMYAFC